MKLDGPDNWKPILRRLFHEFGVNPWEALRFTPDEMGALFRPATGERRVRSLGEAHKAWKAKRSGLGQARRPIHQQNARPAHGIR